MAKLTLNKKITPIIPSRLFLKSSTIDICSTINVYNIFIQKGQTKYINFINNGYGAEFIGKKGIISNSTTVTLKINGNNTGDNLYSGNITMIIRDKKNGTIEHIVTLTRQHNNTFC